MADENPTGLGCPTCWNNGQGIKAMLFARPGKYAYYCRTGHEFPDIQELQALNPPKLPVPQKQTIQQGHSTVQISIPDDLKNQLLAKFGSPDRLSQTLAGVFRVLAEKECFLFNEIDIERVEKISGIKPKNGGELVGILYERNEKVKELTAQLGTSQGQTAQSSSVNVPEGKLLIEARDFLPKARGIAIFRKETVEQVCENTLKLAFENGWA